MVDANGYTTKEVARLTGMKQTTVNAWVYRGKIKSVKHTNGRYNVIPHAEVERLKKELEDFDRRLAEANTKQEGN